MASKIKLNVGNFDLLVDALKAYSKVADCAKLEFSPEGMEISGRNQVARCELSTNAVSSKTNETICIPELSTCLKLMESARTLSKEDLSDIELYLDYPFIRISSKRLKTKITACKEEIIASNVIPKMKAVLTPSMEFTTSTNLIKALNYHSFIFAKKEDAKIYLSEEPDMKKNTLFATIGNKMNDLSNAVTLEFGMINYGTLGDRKLVMDYDRLNMLNLIPSESIKVQLMEKPIATTRFRLENGDYKAELLVLSSFKVDVA